MATKLTLNARKNIKDHEPKLQTHLATIAKATGITFEVDVDWLVWQAPAKAKGYEDKAGQVLYDRYIGGLARMIEKFAGDSIQHEAFVEAFGERHLIKFELHDDAVEGRNSNSTHQWVSNSSGELVIHIYAHHFNSEDSYYTGRNLDEACSDGGPLTVAARKNIKDKSALRDKHLARIQKATGVDYEVEVDWADWTAALKHKGSYAQDNVGTTVYGEYLDALAENIEKLCKDDMCKEALVEATGKKTIHFRIIPQDQLGNINSKCHSVKFSEDGTMIVATSDDNICKDTRNCGNDMQSNL